jgi:hypothetical protein
MMNKTLRNVLVSLGIIYAVMLLLIGVSNWAFPQGKAYFTGDYIEYDDGRLKEEWKNEPSPMSNPTWVRFFQDNEKTIIYVPIIVLFVGFIVGASVGNWIENRKKV